MEIPFDLINYEFGDPPPGYEPENEEEALMYFLLIDLMLVSA